MCTKLCVCVCVRVHAHTHACMQALNFEKYLPSVNISYYITMACSFKISYRVVTSKHLKCSDIQLSVSSCKQRCLKRQDISSVSQ
jgi:hypothetical protein